MRKLIIPVLLLLSIFACTGENKGGNSDSPNQVTTIEDRAKAVSDVKVDNGSSVLYQDETDIADHNSNDSIAFEKYAVEIDQVKEKAKLDFNSNPGSLHFKSRITNGYKSGDINFAGHYIGIAFGCGGGCIMGFIVDVKDGKIYDAPLGEENMCVWTVGMNSYIPESRLYISAICKEEADSKDVFYKAYVWNEKEKIFKKEDSRKFIGVNRKQTDRKKES